MYAQVTIINHLLFSIELIGSLKKIYYSSNDTTYNIIIVFTSVILNKLNLFTKYM